MYVDVHAHIDLCYDVDAVVDRAKKVGVKHIITNGVNLENNKTVLSLAKNYDLVSAALGLYPTDADKASEEEINDTIEHIKKNKGKIDALGEIGLDLKWLDDLKKQTEVFEQMLDVAKSLKKPVIVHSRNAEKHVVDCLLSSSVRKIDLHCFGGKMKIAKVAIDEGWSFSIPTNCVRDQHFQKLIAEVPLKQLLTETDTPYLAPVKDAVNEPANVVESVKVIAKKKTLDIDECTKIIYSNYQKMFL